MKKEDRFTKIKFNENFEKNALTMYKVSSPATNRTVMSAINYYQISCIIPYIRNGSECYSNNESAWSTGLKRLVNKAKNGDVMLFVYFTSSFGHAVVIKNYGGTDSNGNFKLTAWDNRYPTKDITVLIGKDYKTCIVNGSEKATSVEFTSEFDEFNSIDIDGPNNNMVYSAVTSSKDTSTTFITVNAGVDSIISDNNGKNLTIENGTISGNMEIVSKHLIVHSSADNTVPGEYLLEVKASECYSFSSDSGKLSATVIGDDFYGNVDGNNIEDVVISENDGITVIGKSADYTASMSVNSTSYDVISFKGKTDKKANVNFVNGSVIVTGNSNSNDNSLSVTSTTGEVQTMSFKTNSNTVKISVDEYVAGDVDGNGEINVSDARFTLRAAIKLTDNGLDFSKAANREFKAADTNGDATIDVNDARNVLRVAIKLDNTKNWKKFNRK